MMKRMFLALPLVLGAAAAVTADTVVDKQPDFGPWWNPIGNGGSYVYASDFICPDGETTVAQLGSWLEPLGTPNSVVAFQIWGGDEASGPDPSDVIATTDDFSGATSGLNLYVHDVVNQTRDLEPGQRYWFVITGVGRGEPSNPGYRTGGHTQNSSYQDNGTFWFSNDQNGMDFDGQRFTPQIAFQVHLAGGMSLAVNGSCPGTMSLDVSGATPNGSVAFIYAFGTGSQVIPNNLPCAGTELGLNATATLLGTATADANGAASFSGNAPAAACGRVFVQAIDLTSCTTTNVEGL